jgi:hypothetical protein
MTHFQVKDGKLVEIEEEDADFEENLTFSDNEG